MSPSGFRWLKRLCCLWGGGIALSVLGYVLLSGLPAAVHLSMWGRRWSPEQDAYGAFGFLIGTVGATVLGMAFALPLGLGAALSMELRRDPLLRWAVELLACCPTVVLGLFGLLAICPLVQRLLGGQGASLLSAGLTLGMVGFPTVAALTAQALEAQGRPVYLAGLCLGLRKERSIVRLALPQCRGAALHAAITAGLRMLGETTALLLVAGNAENGLSGLLSPVRTLACTIALEMGYAAGAHRSALYGCGAGLLLLTLSVLAGREAFGRE